MAGSSVALLIPSLLELGWIRHMELKVVELDDGKDGSDEDEDESEWWISPSTNPFGKWWLEKLKCYVLLILGLVFFGIGTYASIADIVRIYSGSE
jgi:hypothetical protein